MLDYFSPTKFCHQHAETKGLAPELMEGVMGILKPSGGAGAGAGGDGGGAGGGIDMAAVMGLISSLTNRWLGWCDPSIVEEAILRRMVNVALAQGWRRRRSCRWFPPAIGRRCRWRGWGGSVQHEQHRQDPPRPRQVLLQCQERILSSYTGLPQYCEFCFRIALSSHSVVHNGDIPPYLHFMTSQTT